ncbi:MAG: thioredoxin family protein [Fimbriimonas sp.]|jgi:thiol:disulfide interchange protein|nr:thioredoxin family protein [Fimbriimonadaceae bacterium]
MKLGFIAGCALLASFSVADLKWTTDMTAAKKLAAKTKKLIFIDFHAEWCGPCKMLDKEVFKSAAGEKILKDFILVKQDVDREGRVLSQQLGVTGLPSLFVMSSTGTPILMSIGYMPATELQRFVDEAVKKSKAKTPTKKGG